MRRSSIVMLLVLFMALMAQACAQPMKMKISGNSMLPTLDKGARVTVDKKAYEKVEPQRGDIVAFKGDNGTLIKRVVGLPGETIEIKDGKVYIDGEELAEPYLYEQGKTGTSVNTSWSIHSGYVFVMGDNRGASADSRNFGTVAIKDIIGKVSQ